MLFCICLIINKSNENSKTNDVSICLSILSDNLAYCSHPISPSVPTENIYNGKYLKKEQPIPETAGQCSF